MPEPDIDLGMPLERHIRRHPRVAFALGMAAFLSPLWLNLGLQLINHWSAK